MNFEQELKGRKVLVTGHTGFTGSWSCLWLDYIGAEVMGFALPPDTSPSLFKALNLEDNMKSEYGDICNYSLLLDVTKSFQPEVILHLAAQPLVRESYFEPLKTISTNVLGTSHVLEVARNTESVKAVLCVTTDKVYKNNEWSWPYRENDALGGKDPYSASKAAAELVAQSYASSFPFTKDKGFVISTVRGGNIIGGGDWSKDRLIPDFVRSIVDNKVLTIRYPDATRPWQHVLALVYGYLMLLAGMLSKDRLSYARPWNLGPQDIRQYSVRNIIELMSENWNKPQVKFTNKSLPESVSLALDSSNARNMLNWISPWDTERVVLETANWYREYYQNPSKARELTLKQIKMWRQEINK